MANGDRWKAVVATTAVVVTLAIAAAAAHTGRPHKGAVTIEMLTEHNAGARRERQQINAAIDRVEREVIDLALSQATMLQTLERIDKRGQRLP